MTCQDCGAAYLDAKRERAEAYSAMWAAAGANPHRPGTAEFYQYQAEFVLPLREAFSQASRRLQALT